MTRATRIMAAANVIRSVIDGRAKWITVTVSGLAMDTRYAMLDSRALHELREQLDSLIEEARLMERKR